MRYLAKFGQMNAPHDLVINGLSFGEFKQLYFSNGENGQYSIKVVSNLLLNCLNMDIHYKYLYIDENCDTGQIRHRKQ